MAIVGKALESVNTDKNGVVVRELKTQLKAFYNILTEIFLPPGIDATPQANDRVIAIKRSESGSFVITGVLLKDAQSIPGELRLFSRNSAGAEQGEIFLKADGSIELNGNTQKLAMYGPLNTGLQSFITDLNAKLVTAFTAVGGSWPGTSLDISTSETTTLKTGG